MYAPITSEINLETGMVLKEIATEQLFELSERLPEGTEVLGDAWKITPIGIGRPDAKPSVILSRQELSERYFAAVED